MICGEFDLSVGSVFALMPMTMAVIMTFGVPFLPAVLAGFLVCVAIGLVNGYVTLKFDIPSFITTLGMLFIARSLTVVISGGFPPLLSTDIPSWLFTAYVGPGDLFRMSFLWFVAIAILAGYLLGRTNFGNWIAAVGGFREAAAATGVSVNSVKMICFVLSAVLAGFAGMIQVMRLGSPLPSIGDGMELEAVAAAVIGGTALTGGIGTVLGGIIGAVLIRIIDNGLVLSQVDANWFKFAVGFLTIFAVVANTWLRTRARKIKLEVSA
jgi:simple sugar transport system permease protein